MTGLKPPHPSLLADQASDLLVRGDYTFLVVLILRKPLLKLYKNDNDVPLNHLQTLTCILSHFSPFIIHISLQ